MNVEKDFFTPFVGKKFPVVAQDLDSPLVLELFKIDQNIPCSGLPNGRHHPFALIFKGPRDRILRSQAHKLQCEGTNFELFLQVIVYPEFPDAIVYEAVFN